MIEPRKENILTKEDLQNCKTDYMRKMQLWMRFVKVQFLKVWVLTINKTKIRAKSRSFFVVEKNNT